MLKESLLRIRSEIGELQYSEGRFELAARILDSLVTSEDFVGFMTLVAYDYLDQHE